MQKIYVSGRLTLFSCPSNYGGEWIKPAFLSSHSSWHRVLDANSFLWLRDAVKKAIGSGRLPGEVQEVLARLEWVKAVGIEHGCFEPDEIADSCQTPAWFNFNSGLPSWADDCDTMMPSRSREFSK